MLVPRPDGKYNEFLIAYNLTETEREKLQAGLPIDTNGKTQVTEMANGTFNGGNQLARLVCTTSSYSYWAPCSGTQHHDGSNYESCPIYQGLEQGTPPINYTIVTTTCLDINDDVITPTDPGGNSGGGGGGSTPGGTTPPPNDPPCTEPIIPTSPEPGFTDENGCPIGSPSLPNLPPKNNPCEKTKNMLNRPNVQTGINNVKAQALNTLSNINAGEIGFKEKKDGTIAPADVNALHKVIYKDVTDGYGGYHNHTALGTHMFSPPDIADTLLGFAAAQDNVSDAYFGMIAAEWCNCPPSNKQYIHYVMQYTGSSADIGTGGNYNFTHAQVNQFVIDYQKIVSNLANKSKNGTTYIKNSAGDLNEKGLEKLFFETLKIMGMSGKVNLQRIEPNGNIYNVTLDSNNIPVATPCP